MHQDYTHNIQISEILKIVGAMPQDSVFQKVLPKLQTIVDLAIRETDNYNEMADKTKYEAESGNTFYFDEKRPFKFRKEIWDELHACNMEKEMDNQKNIKNDDFGNIIKNIKKDLENNASSSKYLSIIRDLFKQKNFENFVYNFFHQMLSVGHKGSQRYPYTKHSIMFGEAILAFVIAELPLTATIFDVFDCEISKTMTENVKIRTISLVSDVFSGENEKTYKNTGFTKGFFETLNIFIKELFYEHALKNEIYIPEIKKIVENNFKLAEVNTEKNKEDNEEEYIHIYNKSKVFKLILGELLIRLLIEKKAFSVETFQRKKKKDTKKYLIPDQKILMDFLGRKPPQKPYLQIRQLGEKNKTNQNEAYKRYLEKRDDRFIHENPRITLKITDNSYLKHRRLLTLITINKNTLGYFLKMILHNAFEERYILSLYDIDYERIEQLMEYPIIKQIIEEYILPTAKNFHALENTKPITKRIESNIKSLKEKVTEDDAFTKNQLFIYEINKETIFDIINKICQRKRLLINLLLECIENIFYEYIIFSSYIDTRGRSYTSASYLNLFSNPFGKLFLHLYDPNQGRYPSNEALELFKSFLKMQHSKDEVDKLIKEKDKSKPHQKIVYTYILNHFKNISENDLLDIIKQEPEKEDLLAYIWKNVKKKKNLFYVFSLIMYQIKCNNKTQDKHCLVHVQGDISSSGYQVMTALFRDPKMAEYSNVKIPDKDVSQEDPKIAELSNMEIPESDKNVSQEETDFQLYKKGADYDWREYENMRSAVYSILDYLNIRDEIMSMEDLTIKPITVLHFTQAFMLNSLVDIVKSIIIMDLDTSSVIPESFNYLAFAIGFGNSALDPSQPFWFGNNRVDDLFKDLPLEDKKFIENINDKSVLHQLKYILVLRYSLRIVLIGENILRITKEFFTRDITKPAIMTTIYTSTPYTRKEVYLALLQKKFLISKFDKYKIQEFAAFLETSTTKYLNTLPELKKIFDFRDDICNGKPIKLINKNFEITFNPRNNEKTQISCPSVNKIRGPQLVVKKLLKGFDNDKLKTMVIPNIAHTMDSSIVHEALERIINYNEAAKEQNIKFRLIFDKNHDCFLLNYAPLIKILIDDIYLCLCEQDPMGQIKGLPEHIVKKYIKLSIEEFLKKITPLSPHSLKFG